MGFGGSTYQYSHPNRKTVATIISKPFEDFSNCLHELKTETHASLEGERRLGRGVVHGRHDVRLRLLGQPGQRTEAAAALPRRRRRRRRVVRRRGPVGQRRGGLGEAEVGGVAADAAAAEDGVAEEDGSAAAPRFAVSVKGGPVKNNFKATPSNNGRHLQMPIIPPN